MFSAAERATVNLKQNKGSGQQMLAMLKKAGVKDAELSALGLDKFLEGNRKVTKDEIIDHLVENQITVEETMLGGEAQTAGWRAEETWKSGTDINPIGTWRVYDETGAVRGSAYDVSNEGAAMRQVAKGKPTKHASHVEPGAVEGSYRELLLRLPEKNNRSGLPEGYSLVEGTGLKKWEVYGPGTSRYSSGQTKAEAIGSFWDMHDKAGSYTGGHYGEHPNVLAHIRFNIRKLGDKLILFIEEIQSDWHQEGRKKGYADPQKLASLKKRYDEVVAGRAATMKEGETVGQYREKSKALHDEEMRLIDEMNALHDGVPDAPFKTSWHELAMKRMIKYAADNGYDAIAWTKGETQAARYDLSKHVDEIHHGYKTMENDVVLNQVTAIKSEGQHDTTLLNVFIKEDGIVARGKAGNADVTGKHIIDIVGKEIAEKIMRGDSTGAAPFGGKKLSGGDLKVGGEFHKNLYDRKLPRMKTWKKLGLKVESVLMNEPPTPTPGHPPLPTIRRGNKTPKEALSIFPDGTITDRGAKSLLRKLARESFWSGVDAEAARLRQTALHQDGVTTESWAIVQRMINPDEPTIHLVALSPDVKAKVLDTGLARFMPDSGAPNTSRNRLGYALLLSKSGKWRVYAPKGELVGIGATRAKAEKIFGTHYKRGLRKSVGTGKARFMPEGRAKTGGEYGKNKEFYKGGQYLPRTELSKRQHDKVRKAAAGREQFERGYGADKYAVPKPGEAPILRHFSTFMNDKVMERGGFDVAQLRQLRQLRQKYEAGERWFKVSEYPDMATFRDAARLFEAGIEIPGAILAKEWAEPFRQKTAK